jgi:hypothetical protein
LEATQDVQQGKRKRKASRLPGEFTPLALTTHLSANKVPSFSAGISPSWESQMDNRIEDFYDRYLNSLKAGAPAYGLLYFDHLYSEYMAIRSLVDAASQQLMEAIHQRRTGDGSPLTWGDIYLFDLELLKFLPPEALLSKAYDMRSRYRNVAGEKDYELYIANKPPDLSAAKVSPGTPPTGTTTGAQPPAEQSPAVEQSGNGAAADQADASSKPAENQETNLSPPEQSTGTNLPAPVYPRLAPLKPEVEMALREDIKYLLKVFYLDYSLMKVREGVREQLLRKGTKWTLLALVVTAIFIFLNDLGSKLSHDRKLYLYSRGLTVGVVVAAGCIGGLMSMLQRILSAPSEGDALFNLASLTNGWRSIFLAPLTGAVFAVLLFVLFAGGVLKGTVFPDIYTPSGPLGSITQISQTPTADSSPTPSPEPSATPKRTQAAVPDEPSGGPPPGSQGGVINAPKTAASEAGAKSPTPTHTPTPTPSPTPSPTPAATEGSSVPFSDFIQQTGPTSGINYALLIVWSFIAGFAERLVPDALTKLVAKTDV